MSWNDVVSDVVTLEQDIAAAVGGDWSASNLVKTWGDLNKLSAHLKGTLFPDGMQASAAVGCPDDCEKDVKDKLEKIKKHLASARPPAHAADATGAVDWSKIFQIVQTFLPLIEALIAG